MKLYHIYILYCNKNKNEHANRNDPALSWHNSVLKKRNLSPNIINSHENKMASNKKISHLQKLFSNIRYLSLIN